MIDPTAFGVCIPFPILAILSVVARFISRGRSKLNYAADDWLILPALILSIGNAGNVLWCAIVGNLGQHEPRGPDGQIEFGPEVVTLLLSGYISEILVTTSITLARISIILFYLRIFAGPRFRMWAFIIGGFNAVYGLVFVFLFAFQCSPPSEFWSVDQSAREHCVNNIVNVPYAFLSILLDVAVLCMPWPMVWSLQLQLKQKLAVLGIFMLGGVVVAVSIGKTYAFATVFQHLEATHDYTYFEAPLLYWTVPECCLSIVCACLPTLRPLFRGLSPESLFRSLRSFVSLRSFTTRSRDDGSYALRSDNHQTYDMHGSFAGGERLDNDFDSKQSHHSIEHDGNSSLVYHTKDTLGASYDPESLKTGPGGVPTTRGRETRPNRL